MLRIMVQGDRDAKGIEFAIYKLGMVCKEREIGLNVGETGEIVHLLVQSGANCRLHPTTKRGQEAPPGFKCEQAHCHDAAEEIRYLLDPQVNVDRVAWGIRLACLAASDGFIFFPGREGTLAHLVYIMAIIAKGERDKGVARPRRVALLGWNEATVTTLYDLFGFSRDKTLNLAWSRAWLHNPIQPEDIVGAVDWLTDGLPGK